MASASFHFPKGFLWGTATAAHQVEGGNTNNNWHRWEQEGHTPHHPGLACDWWGGRWKEDLDRAAEGGQNAHRLSLEWSRIQPEPERWDEEALERYRTMLRGMRDRGLAAMVTLHHFTDPLWLSEKGGWESEGVVSLFEAYTRKVVEALKEYCTLWCTINEPNVYAIEGYVRGRYPPGKNSLREAMRVEANMARAHAAAYRAIHQVQPEGRAGYALHFRPQKAANRASPLDQWMRRVKFKAINLAFPSALASGVMHTPLGRVRMPEVKGTQDFLGLNYYCVDTVKFDLSKPGELFSRSYFPEGSDISDSGDFANMPEGLFWAVHWANKTFRNLPVLVTENGIEDKGDRMRPRFLAENIHALWRAVNFCWPVKGYFHWTLVDNFEWENGWEQRFGLWALDLETQQRSKRPSADLYAAICKENGLTAEMVQQYCPEIYAKTFPG